MVGGTPLIPPFEGVFCAGIVVVMFTDIAGCVGGSNGKGPCKDTMGSRVAANASLSGPSIATGWSLSTGMAVFGPQVST